MLKLLLKDILYKECLKLLKKVQQL